ncbi:MAG: hypothetical protein GC162_02185 [Planctomycetes bacterium]|nr:hypothetical protein [Planctomycetota bacterium]
MAGKWFAKKVMPIGLDLGASSVKMVQFASGSNGLYIAAAARYDLPPQAMREGPERFAALQTAVGELYASAPFTGRQVVSLLPDAVVQYKNVRMPMMPPDELASAVQFEANDRFNSANGPAAVQHVIAGEVHQGDETRLEVMLMAAPQATIDAYMNVFTENNLHPMALDVAPTALARCFGQGARRESDADTVRVLVDLGYASSKVLIMRGHQIAFYKGIDLGGRAINDAVAAHLKITPADAATLRRKKMLGLFDAASEDPKLFGSTRREDVDRALNDAVRPVLDDLAKEIGLCQRYHSVTFRGARSGEVHLCGGEAYDTQIASVISERLEVQTTVAEPLARIDLGDCKLMIERRGAMPEWAAAAGLALRGCASEANELRGAA